MRNPQINMFVILGINKGIQVNGKLLLQNQISIYGHRLTRAKAYSTNMNQYWCGYYIVIIYDHRRKSD